MVELPLHPALVHLPLGVALILPLVAALVLAGWWTGRLPRFAWWLAVLLQVVVVAGSFVAMETGEDEEERVEEAIGHDAIHEHEEAAEAFSYAGLALLLVFVGAALLPKEPLARKLAAAGVLGSLATAGLGLDTGHHGGELVYVHGAGSVGLSPPAAAPAPR